MNLENIVEKLSLEVKIRGADLHREITGAYVSDLLSDVMANAKVGELWITLQIHPNIAAVAVLKELGGIILVNGRQAEAETIMKAEAARIPILSSALPAFQLAGRLYQLFEKC